MTTRFHLFNNNDNIFDCILTVKDCVGIREFTISVTSEVGYIDVETNGEAFDMTLTPTDPRTEGIFGDIKGDTWKDKLAIKLGKAMTDTAMNMIYRLSCTYHIENAAEVKDVFLQAEEYIFGSELYDLIFDIPPLFCTYYEADCNGTPLTPIAVKGQDRKRLLKFIRGISLLQPILYPLNVTRARIISRDKYLTRTLRRFYSLSPEKREKKRKKWNDM